MIINICHLYGNLLNTYGDVGNIMALKYFAQKKGHEVNIEVVSLKMNLIIENMILFFLAEDKIMSNQL